MSRDFAHFGKDFKDKEKELGREIDRTIPRKVGEVHIRGFKESFDKGRFNDYGSQKWKDPKRTNPPFNTARQKRAASRDTLVGKGGGHLKDSFEVDVRKSEVHIRNTREYAKIHNEGGSINTYKASIKIPKRQFMGHSKKLDEESGEKMDFIIEKILK